jgi:hypothetical protein
MYGTFTYMTGSFVGVTDVGTYSRWSIRAWLKIETV